MPSRKTTATATTKKTTTKRKVAKRPTQKGGKRLRVRQVRSEIGSPGAMRRTLVALGLKHHQDETTVPDNPSIQGMLRKVHHLVRVVGEEG